MDFPTLKQLLIDAETNGTLLTPKHDPNQLSSIFTPFRSVVSHEISSDLMKFINSENYTVEEYQNTRYSMSPLYFAIKPNPGAIFSVAASGVTGISPSSTLDTLVVVSGNTSGIHMYGECSSRIQAMEKKGQLINKRKIK